LLLLAVGCGLAAVICAVMAGADARVLAWVGRAGVVLLLLAAVVLIGRALRPGPTVVIDGEGITDRTTLASIGLVRWDEITVIRKREIGRGLGAERLLEIVLSRPEEFRARPRGWLRRVADGYRTLLRLPPVSIPGSMVSAPMQALMDEIRRRRPQLQVLEGPPPVPRFRFGRRAEPRRRHPDLPRW
jgi:hypothetical protein